MLKLLKLQKKRTALQASLVEKRNRRKQLRAEEASLQQQLDSAADLTPELEDQIDELTAEQTEIDDAIADLQDQIDALDEEISQLEDSNASAGDPAPVARSGSRPASPSVPVASGAFSCRSRCFDTRAARDAFYTRTSVKEFLQRVRNSVQSRRSVSGAALTIPTEILEVLRDNLNQYSKLITKVRLRPVKGKARQHIIGEVPEGVWTEMAGALNQLSFGIKEIEVDGYKVGGFIPISNYLLQDSDVNLGEEIMYMLGQAIGLALDKAIVYGLGPTSKMPVGFVTRLGQSVEPGYWGENQGDWKDLRATHMIAKNLSDLTGEKFFIPLLTALSNARPKLQTGERIWIMNEKTRDKLLINALGFNASAAIVSGMNDTMPIIGGQIITLEFMNDDQIAGGYLGMYVLAEREGSSFAQSEHVRFIEDQTVFKGTARYDGQPVDGECFVAVSIGSSAVQTTTSFMPDTANSETSAAGEDSEE